MKRPYSRDMDRARHNLRALLRPVRLMPDASGQFLVADGQMDTIQLLEVARPLVRKCGAGAGFNSQRVLDVTPRARRVAPIVAPNPANARVQPVRIVRD